MGRQSNCMIKPSNVTGPKTRQSESKMMFQSQMMKNNGRLSPSSERYDRSTSLIVSTLINIKIPNQQAQGCTMGYREKNLRLEDPIDGHDNVSRGIIFPEQRILIFDGINTYTFSPGNCGACNIDVSQNHSQPIPVQASVFTMCLRAHGGSAWNVERWFKCHPPTSHTPL